VTRIQAKIISEPAPKTRTVFIGNMQFMRDASLPFVRGKNGDRDIVCGNCSRILLEKILDGQVTNIVIKCPACNSYNEIM
jgi:hypothetical protein